MRRLMGLALCALLSGCPERSAEVDAGVDAGPGQLAEKEPNDRPPQAQALASSMVVTAQLAVDPAKPDEDWFKLSSARAQAVDLTVSGMPAGDVVLEVMDVDGNRLALVNSQGVGEPERLPNLHLSGEAFVRVTSAKRGTGGAYTLTALFGEPTAGYESEPNDRAADANLAALGEGVSAFVGHSGDEDWFRFELPVPEAPLETAADAGAPPRELPVEAPLETDTDAGEAFAGTQDAGTAAAPEAPQLAMRIELTKVPGVQFEVSVLSEAEAPLFQTRSREAGPLSLRNVGVRATDRVVYVVVKSAWAGTGKDAKRGFNADQPYTLTVSLEEAGANAELEPNDELAKATALPLEGFREGFLSPKNDVDFFVLRPSQPVLAKLVLSGVERMDLVLSSVAPSEKGEQTLLKVNDGAVKEQEVLNSAFCEKECWFKVEGALKKVEGKWVRAYENAELPYRLTVTTTPDDGGEEHEPNNTVERATPLEVGKSVRGTIQPKKDVDYYRVDLSSRPVKTALKATALGILKVDIGLYLHRVDEEGKLELVQTADRAKGDAPEVIRFAADPGVYVLEVRDSRSRDANFQDRYQLTLEEGS